MKKTLFTLSFFLLASLSYCQEKIVEKYIVQVTYIGGGTEKIEVKNDRHLKVPAPIVKDGSIFYDEEYLLLNVKNIKILNTVYEKSISKPKKSKYVVTKARYWNERLHQFVTLNVISDPEAEKAQRETEAEQRKTALFHRSDEVETSKSDLKQNEQPKVEKDTIIAYTEQIVCEVKGKNIRNIKNSTLRLEGNIIKYRSYEDLLQENFIKENIEEKSDEYLLLSQLSLNNGIYIIEKKLNKNNQIVSIKKVPVKLGD